MRDRTLGEEREKGGGGERVDSYTSDTKNVRLVCPYTILVLRLTCMAEEKENIYLLAT